MAETPVTADELGLAKEALVGDLTQRFEVTDQTVTALSDVFVYDLGASYFSEYPKKLSNLNIAQIQATARKYLATQKPLIVAVGDRQKIEGPMKELGVGTTEFRNVDGAIVK
jgi:zinc protease